MEGQAGSRLYKTQIDVVFCRDDSLARLPFRGKYGWSHTGKIAMSDRRDGEGTVVVLAGIGAALAKLQLQMIMVTH
jgi:hypothetical protein